MCCCASEDELCHLLQQCRGFVIQRTLGRVIPTTAHASVTVHSAALQRSSQEFHILFSQLALNLQRADFLSPTAEANNVLSPLAVSKVAHEL